jgi:hypothetical protein
MERRLANADDLAGPARAAFGAGRRLDAAARLRGGSQKGVYRLTFDDGGTAIIYVWSAAENYWPQSPGDAAADRAGPFSAASGAHLFEASQARLTALGVRTPRPYLVDRTRSQYPADFAVVEDIRGETLESLLARDPQAAGPALTELGGYLDVMRRERGPSIGKLALAGGEPSPPVEQIVLDRALRQLAEAARRVPRVAAARTELADLLSALAAAIRPRAEYSLVHGELGPDHVFLDERDRPVIIDIEGVMFFDVEWEHAFLRFRFGEHYEPLRVDGLDDRRLEFYALALYLSLIAGPLLLLDGDFPDRDAMMSIAAANTDRALVFLRRQRPA